MHGVEAFRVGAGQADAAAWQEPEPFGFDALDDRSGVAGRTASGLMMASVRSISRRLYQADLTVSAGTLGRTRTRGPATNGRLMKPVKDQDEQKGAVEGRLRPMAAQGNRTLPA